MKLRHETKLKVLACVSAVMIPVLLILDAVQAQKYAKLKDELKKLENTQVELVEKNRKLISDISQLSSSDRIEKIAEEELGMKKAETEEIVRVEIQ